MKDHQKHHAMKEYIFFNSETSRPHMTAHVVEASNTLDLQCQNSSLIDAYPLDVSFSVEHATTVV
jgi:hypothetical protein